MTRNYSVPRFRPGSRTKTPGSGYVWRLDRRIAQLMKRGRREGACLIWTGKTAHGYAQTTWQGVPRYVHVIAYELAHGPVPDGMEVDHECNRRACFEATHLRAMTHRDNVLRSETAPPAVNARKTHCPRGHGYTPSNTYVAPNGSRQCRACWPIKAKARRQSQRGASNGQAIHTH
jgi:hypothetical protein